MFSTLKILALIGGLTFLGGNSLLSSIAARRSAGYKTIIKDSSFSFCASLNNVTAHKIYKREMKPFHQRTLKKYGKPTIVLS